MILSAKRLRHLPLLLLPLLATTGCQQQNPTGGQQVGSPTGSIVRVTVLQPERKTIRQTVEQPAQIEAFEITPLYSRVEGYVRRVDVDMGDHIHGPRYNSQGKLLDPGQSLAEFSIPEIDEEVKQKRAAIVQAQAEAAQARAAVRVAEAKIETAKALIAQATAAMTKAAGEYDKSKSEYDRFVELASKAAVAQKLVDETRDQLAAADASRQEAAAQMESAKAAVKESSAVLDKANADVDASEARVQVAQADFGRANAIVQYGTLRAPFDGIVSRRNVHTGHLVHASGQGEPLFVVVRTDSVRIFLDVPETDADLVDDQDEAVIRVPAMKGLEFHGKVTRISWSLDMTARTLRAEVDVPNQDGKLRPGMYAYASIVLAEHKDALVVPASAVGTDKGQSFCLVVEDGKIVRKPVTMGLKSGTELEVVKGLSGTDQKIVRANLAAYSAGQPVEAVPYVAPK
jgi:HlyD family secretion protein